MLSPHNKGKLLFEDAVELTAELPATKTVTITLKVAGQPHQLWQRAKQHVLLHP